MFVTTGRAASRRSRADSLGAAGDTLVFAGFRAGGVDAMMRPMTSDPLAAATSRLVRTVDALDDAAYAEDSLLPGWTRSHVVAHLALNAEALADALRGVVAGEPVAMYPGDEARDAAIEELAAAGPTTLRARLYAAATELADAVAAVPEDRLDAVVERTPGSERTFPAHAVPAMRLAEVEIHHADLGAGYTAADWPVGFAVALVERRHAAVGATLGATLVATDAGRTWQAEAGPTVSGTAGHLGWWLTGRGGDDSLTTDSTDGELPRIEAW